MDSREIDDLWARLEALKYDRSMAERAQRSLFRPGYDEMQVGHHYELPTHIEEVYTLRTGTSEIYVITGVEEVEDEEGFKLAAVVSVVIPFTGREIGAMVESMGIPDFVSDMYTDLPTDHIKTYLIVMAKDLGTEISEALEDDELFELRKRAEIGVLKVVCENMGFRIFYSESGVMDRRIPDEWIAEREIRRYNSNLRSIEESIAGTPDSYGLWYKKGGLLLSRDRWDEAEQALRRSLEINPTFPRRSLRWAIP